MVCVISVTLPASLLILYKGAVMLMLYPLFCGFPVVILPKFDPDQFCQAIERYKVTAGYVVPPILLVLVHHPGAPNFASRADLD
jgi:acyl-coenzyme A synthetase/AMP-(fatty) acid ligase